MFSIKPTSDWDRAQSAQRGQNRGCFSCLGMFTAACLGGLVLIGFIHYIFSPTPGSNQEEKSAPEDARTVAETHPTPTVVEKPVPHFQLGDVVKVGYWTYEVRNVTWTPFIGMSAMKRADAAFMIVYMIATNNDRTPSTLPRWNRPVLRAHIAGW